MVKKIITVAVLFFVVLRINAQESHLYVKAGLNVANVSISDNGKYTEANPLISFHAGVGADLPLSKCFSIQPSLLFTGKGAKTSYGQQTGSNPTYFHATTKPYYIELPVNFVGKIPLAMDESAFFIGAGPYAAVGIAGKNKSEGKIIGVPFNQENKIKFNSDGSNNGSYDQQAGISAMKRFDYGLNATAGLQLSSIVIAVNYGYGLSDITSGSENNSEKNQHRVAGISLGVRL